MSFGLSRSAARFSRTASRKRSGNPDEDAAEREMRGGEIRIEANGLPRVPLRALGDVGAGVESARLAEGHGDGQIGVGGGEVGSSAMARRSAASCA